VNSIINDEFRALFAELPARVKRQARAAYRRFMRDPSHPSLHFKRIHTHDPIYSVRIGLRYRAVGIVDGGTVTWFWIGSHADYDALLRQR